MVLSAQDDNHNPFISGKTAQGCMCGYGGTVQLANGELLSAYCYTNVTTETSLIGLLRWRVGGRCGLCRPAYPCARIVI